ncbi:MAG: nuclear transport factor 2 family protein [Longimicrobiales bacterium]
MNEPRDVLLRMISALSTGEAEDCDEYIAPSYVDHQGRSGAPLHGPAGFQKVVRAANRTVAPRISVEDVICDETRVVARLRWTFTAPGASDGVDRETIEIVRVEGGKAVEHWGAESWSRTPPGLGG